MLPFKNKSQANTGSVSAAQQEIVEIVATGVTNRSFVWENTKDSVLPINATISN